MDKVNEIMHLILELTDDDIEETRGLIESQISYNNPLRMEKTIRVMSIGNHNKRMLDQLEKLRSVAKDLEGVDE